MNSRLSAILIGNGLDGENGLREAFRALGDSVQLIGAASDLQQGVRALQSGSPQIAILEVDEIEQGVKEVAYLVSHFPRTALFVTASDKNPDWILRLVRAGAQEYLTKPVAAAELVDAVRKVARLQTLAAPAAGKKGAALAVYNPLGGMGTTTLAVNLAAAFADRGKETALIDLNPCSADVATFLDLTPRYTLSSVSAKLGALDASFLRSVIVGHASGIHVLSGPEELGEVARVQPERLQEMIGLSRTIYEYTVIDAGGPLNEENLATFEACDLLLFTSVLSLPALRNAKRHLAALGEAGLSDRTRLVVSRHNPKDEISIADAEKVLGMKTYLSVPNGYADVRASINQGVPLVVSHPKVPVAKALEELATKLLDEGLQAGRYAL